MSTLSVHSVLSSSPRQVVALVLMDLTPDHMEYHVLDGDADEAAIEDETSRSRANSVATMFLGGVNNISSSGAGRPASPAPPLSGSVGGAPAPAFTSIELPERGNGVGKGV